MTTKSKVSTAKKSAKKSVKGAASVAGVSSSAVAAVTAAAVAGGASSSDRAKGLNSGLVSAAAVTGLRASAVAASMDEDIKVSEFRSKVASRWAAPRFEDSEDYKMMSSLLASAPADLRERSLNGARLAWLARPENAASVPSVADVCEYINANFANEFKTLCGCAVPAASAVRVYSYTNLSVSTITADSDINDYFFSSAVPAGLSASGVVSAVMSVRVLVDIKRRFAAACAAARSEFKDCAAVLVRRGRALGLSAAVVSRYVSMLWGSVAAVDDSTRKRLNNNLSRCWSQLRNCENSIVLAGGRGALADGAGGWCFPAAGLAAVLPAGASAAAGVQAAKVRRLWATRVGLLTSIATLETLLSRG